jgi:SAM-dependent methyltransferase
MGAAFSYALLALATLLCCWLVYTLSPQRRRQREQTRPALSNGALPPVAAVTAATVRDDFNDPRAVRHYEHAARSIGLWASERVAIQRVLEMIRPLTSPATTDADAEPRVLECGCGAGRVSIALCSQPRPLLRHIVAFDFAAELVARARALVAEGGLEHAVSVHLADATDQTAVTAMRAHIPPPRDGKAAEPPPPLEFDVVLFLFNGLMQIPGRANRRRAMANFAAVSRPRAVFLFTTHDRNHSPEDRRKFSAQARALARHHEQRRLGMHAASPHHVELGDRYFEEDGVGRTFMHLPDRAEIMEDLHATGWTRAWDAMRGELVRGESDAVLEFSDECRFWAAMRV